MGLLAAGGAGLAAWAIRATATPSTMALPEPRLPLPLSIPLLVELRSALQLVPRRSFVERRSTISTASAVSWVPRADVYVEGVDLILESRGGDLLLGNLVMGVHLNLLNRMTTLVESMRTSGVQMLISQMC